MGFVSQNSVISHIGFVIFVPKKYDFWSKWTKIRLISHFSSNNPGVSLETNCQNTPKLQYTLILLPPPQYSMGY